MILYSTNQAREKVKRNARFINIYNNSHGTIGSDKYGIVHTSNPKANK